ncbi:MAG: electron transfer flavoprotein subunit beta/FixA family protein [Bacteroidetes bacterium]|nr:electron transfer flavoprotein subunit beta/FixA family protein [Bacteroidota bacterium]
MNLFVCVSQVPDTATRIKIRDDGRTIDPADVNFILNPFDEFAVEAALKLKEAHGGEVTILSVGDDSVINTIRKALAMGADKAVHIKAAGEFDGYQAAEAVAAYLKDKQADLVLTGKESVDTNSGQFATFLGAMLDFSVVNVAVTLTLEGTVVKAEREIEGGREVVHAQLPAVVSCQKGLNEPRLPTLKGIMASKTKKPEELALPAGDSASRIESLAKPPAKAAGKIVGSDVSAVPALVDLLMNEAKVI